MNLFSEGVEQTVSKYQSKGRLLKRNFQQVVQETSFLSDVCSIRQCFWHVLNNTKDIPKCAGDNCTNYVKWYYNYAKYCSSKCSTNAKEVKNKTKRTCMDRYNVEYPLRSKKIQDNSKLTSKINYNVEYHNQRHLSKDTLDKLHDINWLTYQHHILKKTLTKIAEELGLANCSSIAKYFKDYNIPVLTFTTSDAEQELVTYIKSIYSGEVQNPNYQVIKPKHLDIYLPDINLAFEFNGLHYHSIEQIINSPVKPKKKNYHFNKYDLCKNKNIKIIHIFENEWENEREDVKYWIKKYISQDIDFITKGLLISDLKDQEELNLSLNWPINIDKLGYKKINMLAPVEQLLTLKSSKQIYKIYDCGRVIYTYE